jgi:hypothetical protein
MYCRVANGGTAWFSIARFNEAKKAGIEQGIQSAAPSIAAIAIELSVVNAGISKLHFKFVRRASIRRGPDAKSANTSLQQRLVSRALKRA